VRLGHGGGHIGTIGDVTADRDRVLADLVGHSARAFKVEIEDRDPGAFAGKGLGNALAKARGGAGHEGCFSVQAHGVFLSRDC
jgi:hypothetical protein